MAQRSVFQVLAGVPQHSKEGVIRTRHLGAIPERDPDHPGLEHAAKPSLTGLNRRLGLPAHCYVPLRAPRAAKVTVHHNADQVVQEYPLPAFTIVLV
jgi:hypothetical protein